MNSTSSWRLVFSISLVKGRFGNNVFHLLNLLSSEEHGIIVIDSSYRAPFKLSGLKASGNVIIFTPFLDKVSLYLYIFFSLVFKLVGLNFQGPTYGCTRLLNAYFIKLYLIFGELLSNSFSSAQFARFAAPELRDISANDTTPMLPCACHIRLGDFKSHHNGFFMYRKNELQDAVDFTALSTNQHQCRLSGHVFTDDPAELKRLIDMQLDLSQDLNNRTYLQDWNDIKRSQIVLSNASTFAITAFLLGTHSFVLVIPRRIFDKLLGDKDPLFSWLHVLKTYNSLVFLAKPYNLKEASAALLLYPQNDEF